MAGPIDPDAPVQPSPTAPLVLAVIAGGGVLGALARSGLATAWPHAPGAFAWSTFVINATGCLLIGVLMVLVTEVWPKQRYIRPFVGVGILGGYTTFSTYIVDILHTTRPVTALAYLAGTLVAALVAVWLGFTLTRLVVR
jgi:fluoride exporter